MSGSQHFAGAFGDWFPLSLLMLGIAATAWIVSGWLAPWRHRVVQAEHERELARALVNGWGVDTLAPFVLRADKSYFFTEDETAFVAYRVVNGVAIVSGDPVGPPERGARLVGRFVDHARACDWRVAILGASERWLPLYYAYGLHALYHGDEAIVDTATFSLEGRAIRKVRQSVHRLALAGFVAETLRPSDIGAALRDDLEAIARAWRGEQPERGFVMALDTLFSLEDAHAVFVVGRGPDGTPRGFLHFALSPASRSPSTASSSSLGAAVRRLRAPPRPAARWNRRARRGGLPAVSERAALNVALALASAFALNWGWLAQHGAARELQALSLRRPLVSLRALFGDRGWLTGLSVGLAGWVLYVAALALAPLSCRASPRAASASWRRSRTDAATRSGGRTGAAWAPPSSACS